MDLPKENISMHKMIVYVWICIYISFMTQSINVRHVLTAVSITVSLHSHAMFVPVFNGLNFFY